EPSVALASCAPIFCPAVLRKNAMLLQHYIECGPRRIEAARSRCAIRAEDEHAERGAAETAPHTDFNSRGFSSTFSATSIASCNAMTTSTRLELHCVSSTYFWRRAQSG